MRKILMIGATLSLLGAGFGCSRTLDKARASYHQERADRAAAKGNYYKAAEQQRKADVDRSHEATDKLP